MAFSKCTMRARLIIASIGLFVGISVFLCFGIGYDNWDTAVWGLLSGIFAGITLILHIWYMRNQNTNYKLLAHRMKPIMILGCFVQLAGVCGIVAYLTVAIFEHQDLTPYGRGFYLTTIWCFMTWKWGFLLFLSARSYRNEFRSLRVRDRSHTKYDSIPTADYVA